MELDVNIPALRHVLYVDDERDIRVIASLALALDPQLRIDTAESGERALALLAREQPDLVILDVMMPGLDGPATLARMQADPRLAHIPVFFVTAKSLPHEQQTLRALGAAGILAKPFDPMRLAADVAALWQRLHSPRRAALDAELDRIAARYAERNAEDLALLAESLEREVRGEATARAQIEHVAHRIAGTGAMLGFTRISAAAAVLERLAGPGLETAVPRLREAYEALRAAIASGERSQA